MTIVIHTRPDFDIAEIPDATLFSPFVGTNPAPRRSQSSKSSLEISSLVFM